MQHNTHFQSHVFINKYTTYLQLKDLLDIMCRESDRFELLSLFVHVTVVPLREAVARKLREETKQFRLLS